MARFRSGLLSVVDATGELGLSRRRFYVLYADFLCACAQRRQLRCAKILDHIRELL